MSYRSLVDEAPKARAMGHYRTEGHQALAPGKRFGFPGPRTGTRIRIVAGAVCGHWLDTGKLRDRYMHRGAYWCRLDEKIGGTTWEIVVRPKDYEVLA